MPVSSLTPGSRLPLPWIAIYASVLLAGIAIACALTTVGLPRPRVDDGFYKSVGAELVQHGRFAVPCATGLYAGAEDVFACYPPLYPLIVGAWYAVFGVSLRSSLAFSYAVHLLGTLAVMLVTRRLLDDHMAGAPECTARLRIRHLIVLGVGVIHLSNLAYFDRIEETGLLWVWLEVLVVQGLHTRPGWGRVVGSGVCVGLAGLTSPWAGALGALVISARTVLSVQLAASPPCRRAWGCAGLRLIATGLVTLALGVSWYATMEVLYPGAIARQLGSGLQQLKQLQCSGEWLQKIRDFGETIGHNPWQLPASLLALMLPVALAGRQRFLSPLGWSLYLGALTAMSVVAVLRPSAHTYLGAAQILLLPCLGPVVLSWGDGVSRSARRGMAILSCCTAFACGQVVVLGLTACCMPDEERPDAVFRRLASTIPPTEPVATLSLHWHAFQGRNPWRDALFSGLVDPTEVLRCRWLVLPAEVCDPDYIGGFELIERRWAQSPWRTYAYSLWRRTAAGESTAGVVTRPPASEPGGQPQVAQ